MKDTKKLCFFNWFVFFFFFAKLDPYYKVEIKELRKGEITTEIPKRKKQIN